jgi:Tol biopolymer transport system component/tRNA A-37 threonylcarbamoyl transferase component Bud32
MTAERLRASLADRYRIERELGAGGMATVYLAEDLRHHRRVAIKVLKPELAAVLGADRFIQEITTTAQLQHPHILPLFDSGSADGFLYYVMPYVEGETLRDKLNRETQLGIEEAVKITTDVADALDYAHRHGVIHRDIKPENILLHDGRPMVADFGIALALSAAAGGRMTETGMSLGTPHYMSPEQATADKDISARSDIYSLASVLYEMLTGEPPHMGNSAQQIIMKIVTEDAAPVTRLRKSVPPNVAAALAQALEKLPADRFDSAKAFADALNNPAFTTATGVAAAAAAPATAAALRRARMAIALLAVAFAASAALAAWGWLRKAAQPAVARFDIRTAGGSAPATSANGASLAIAPDGSRFVYVANDSGLYVRDLGQLESAPLPAKGVAPFFSPDGKWVAYADRDTLKKVELNGGPPLAIASVRRDLFRGGSWGKDGTIVFAPGVLNPLFVVPDGGGPVDTLTHLDTARGVTSDRWPEWLPGQQGVLFEACRGAPDRCEIAVLDRQTDSVRYLVPGLSPHYVSPGYLLYTSPGGTLLAAPFDPDRMELTGKPVSLMEGLLVRASWNGDLAIAPNGTLLYLSGRTGGYDLTLVDTTGNTRVLLSDLVDLATPALSPDGRRVAFIATSGGLPQLWILDRTLKTVSRLTPQGSAQYPAWSPNGDTVYYSGNAGSGDWDIWRQAADGSGAPERALQQAGDQREITIPNTGRFALIRQGFTGGLYTLPLAPVSAPRPWVANGFFPRAPSFSPNGRWVAYTANESGKDEIYVRAFPNAGRRWQVSSGGGTEPLWSSDGRAIYYRRADTMFAAVVQTTPTFSVTGHRMVFTASFQPYVYDLHTNYTRDPRSGDFIMVSQPQGSTAALVVALNWFQVLKQRMAGGQ